MQRIVYLFSFYLDNYIEPIDQIILMAIYITLR